MLTGGACLLTFYYFNRQYKKTPLLLKAFWGALIISIYEFSVGLIVNRWFDWHVWDYSGEPGNILGLVCPAFTLMWFFLCLFGLLISKGLYYGYRHFRP